MMAEEFVSKYEVVEGEQHRSFKARSKTVRRRSPSQDEIRTVARTILAVDPPSALAPQALLRPEHLSLRMIGFR